MGAYLDSYREAIDFALRSVQQPALEAVLDVLLQAYREKRSVYVCGNGGSAAIADHLACDHLKGVATGTNLRPRVISLTSNVPLMTAIANDLSFDSVFSLQLESLAMAGDVLLAVSSRGNSENIIRAVEVAKASGMTTVGMVGFDGGRLRSLADHVLHVRVANYGVVEDTHQSLMHILAHFLRLRCANEGFEWKGKL